MREPENAGESAAGSRRAADKSAGATLIIGYGNPLRGDDAVGQMAAEQLRETVADPEVEILAVHQLTPELMEPISRARRVVFIDAAVGPEPGKIAERRIEANSGSRAFTHETTPEGLLAGARLLFGSSPEATMITITGDTFELGGGLSEAARAALEDIVQGLTVLVTAP